MNRLMAKMKWRQNRSVQIGFCLHRQGIGNRISGEVVRDL